MKNLRLLRSALRELANNEKAGFVEKIKTDNKSDIPHHSKDYVPNLHMRL